MCRRGWFTCRSDRKFAFAKFRLSCDRLHCLRDHLAEISALSLEGSYKRCRSSAARDLTVFPYGGRAPRKSVGIRRSIFDFRNRILLTCTKRLKAFWLCIALPTPQNDEEDESLLQCVANNVDAGGITGAVLGGAAAVGAGSPIVPKSLLSGRAGVLSGGANASGGRTSVLSAAARGFIGQGPKLKPGGFLARATNTGKVASAVGRIASRASIVVGVGLELYALGETAVETYRCANK